MIPRKKLKTYLQTREDQVRARWEEKQRGNSLQQTFTPFSLTYEMLERLPSLEGKDVLVVANMEIFYLLKYLKVDRYVSFKSVTLLTDIEELEGKDGVSYNSFEELDKIDLGMKFDVVIGNPPYQASTNTEGANRQGDYWYKFLIKATECGNTIAFVTPTSIFSSGGFGGKRHKISALLNRGFNFKYINPDVSEMFNVGIKICYYILSNYNTSENTYLPDGDVLNIDTVVPVPFVVNSTNHSIIRKVYRAGGGWPFKEVYKGGQEGYSVRFNGGRFKTYDKVEIGKTSEGVNKGQGIEIESDKVTEYSSVFESKLLKYVFIILGGESGQSATGILQSLPNPGVNRVWTDALLYEKFNLTQEEIDLIESSVK